MVPLSSASTFNRRKMEKKGELKESEWIMITDTVNYEGLLSRLYDINQL